MPISNFVTSLGNAVTYAVQWSINVAIFVTAAMLAISLLSWLIHRSS